MEIKEPKINSRDKEFINIIEENTRKILGIPREEKMETKDYFKEWYEDKDKYEAVEPEYKRYSESLCKGCDFEYTNKKEELDCRHVKNCTQVIFKKIDKKEENKLKLKNTQTMIDWLDKKKSFKIDIEPETVKINKSAACGPTEETILDTRKEHKIKQNQYDRFNIPVLIGKLKRVGKKKYKFPDVGFQKSKNPEEVKELIKALQKTDTNTEGLIPETLDSTIGEIDLDLLKIMKLTREMKSYKIFIEDRKESIKFDGFYIGQKHPTGKKKTKNWHYYLDSFGEIIHIPKLKISYITEKTIK